MCFDSFRLETNIKTKKNHGIVLYIYMMGSDELNSNHLILKTRMPAWDGFWRYGNRLTGTSFHVWRELVFMYDGNCFSCVMGIILACEENWYSYWQELLFILTLSHHACEWSRDRQIKWCKLVESLIICGILVGYICEIIRGLAGVILDFFFIISP